MERRSSLYVLAAGILWGMIGIFVRRLNAYGLAAMGVVMVRALTASLILFVALVVGRRELLRIRLRDLWCFLGTGIGSIVFFNFCYFSAVEMMSLSAAAVLLYTAPVFVMLLSALLFHERMSAGRWIAVLCTFVGCLLVTGVVGSGTRLSGPGILAGLGAGLGYALYSIFGRYALERDYSSVTITFYTFLIAAAASTVLLGGWGTIARAVTASGGRILPAMAGLGIFSTVLPFLLYTIGLQHLEGGRASIIASIEPVAATVTGALVFRERMSLLSLLGMALVLAGIIIVSWSEKN